MIGEQFDYILHMQCYCSAADPRTYCLWQRIFRSAFGITRKCSLGGRQRRPRRPRKKASYTRITFCSPFRKAAFGATNWPPPFNPRFYPRRPWRSERFISRVLLLWASASVTSLALNSRGPAANLSSSSTATRYLLWNRKRTSLISLSPQSDRGRGGEKKERGERGTFYGMDDRRLKEERRPISAEMESTSPWFP